MFRVITSYYHDPNERRQQELSLCLQKNVQHPLIEEVVLLTEADVPVADDHKIRVVKTATRPDFQTIFQLVNERLGMHTIICNADIFFDESLVLAAHLQPGQCYALTRWEYDMASARMRFFNRPDSQDAWILRPPVLPGNLNFSPGKPGCDNRLAYELKRCGLRVTNPSKSIRALHVHQSGIRRYTRKETVPGPYLTLNPVGL